MKNTIYFWGLALIVFLFSCEDDPLIEDQAIVLGGISALTGDASLYGLIDQQVSDLIFDEINASGGINGRQIEVLWKDTYCEPNAATVETGVLIAEDGVQIILGDACSGSTLAAADLTEPNEVILFTAISTSADIKNAGDFVFRVAASDEKAGQVLADYANEHFDKLAMLTEQTAYAQGIASRFEEVFDGQIISLSFSSNEENLEPLVQQLIDQQVDAFIFMPQSSPKVRLVAEALETLNWQKPLLGNEVITIDDQITLDYQEQFATWNAVSASFVPPESSGLDAFLSRFVARYGQQPAVLGYAASTADRNYILLDVLEQVSDVEDTKSIRDALYAIKDYEGMSGTFSFDEFGEVNLEHSLLRFDGGEFVVVE